MSKALNTSIAFTLAAQDVYDPTASTTPGVHTLRIEVKNNGVFSSLNPAGLLYKFEIKTCQDSPISNIGDRKPRKSHDCSHHAMTSLENLTL